MSNASALTSGHFQEQPGLGRGRELVFRCGQSEAGSHFVDLGPSDFASAGAKSDSNSLKSQALNPH